MQNIRTVDLIDLFYMEMATVSHVAVVINSSFSWINKQWDEIEQLHVISKRIWFWKMIDKIPADI